MQNAKAYSAASATSPLVSTKTVRRDLTEHDVQIEILRHDEGNSFVRAFRAWEAFHRLAGGNNSVREQHHNWARFDL